jgi:deoxyribose-phosphate aldolase
MQWFDTVKSPEMIQRVISLLDLTNLNENAKESDIAALCEKAETSFGHVAAVCVYPKFVSLLATQFENKPIKVGTVANFPHGNDSLEDVLIEIGRALQEGAQEIDVVFPYQRYLKNDRDYANTFVTACKAACGDEITLKIILETAMFATPEIITAASADVLFAGADFIKTSTGKVQSSQDEDYHLKVAGIMLLAIRDITPKLDRKVGIKISGGIKEFAQAVQYIELADQIMGRDWVTPKTFRIGSSKLMDDLLG